MISDRSFTALLFIVIIILSIVSIEIQSLPLATKKDAPSSVFSAERAYEHLKIIAKEPHSAGTKANEIVLNYIRNFCLSHNLKVSIQDTTALYVKSNNFVNASRVKNIIATLPGFSSDSGSILIMAHYDSQPNTPGASDDGSGVAAMLETIRILGTGEKLQHDVIFLFTDQEELGLFGAEAFINLSPLAKKAKIVLNYESRGNDGVAFVFEVTPNNAWIINQFAQAAPYPVASSVAYEVYKLMPNSSDFTHFKNGDYAGINQANIGGFVNYHSPTDTPENVNLGIMEQHGANMLALINQIDKQDLNKTSGQDVNFFNPIAKILWHYPLFWNKILILFAAILFILITKQNLKSKVNSIKNVFRSLLFFLAVTFVSLITVFLLHQIILILYPVYNNFYGNNFYNSAIYFYVFLSSVCLIFSIFYTTFLKSYSHFELTAGAILFLFILLILFDLFLPTASYLIYYPLISYLLFNFLADKAQLNYKLAMSYIFIGSLPALFLFIPFIYTLYTVFSLALPIAPMLLFLILCIFYIPLILIWRNQTKLIVLPSLICLIVSLILGHLNSYSTNKTPVQTMLFYYLDRDKNGAKWVTDNKYQDNFLKSFVNTKTTYKKLNHTALTKIYKGYESVELFTGIAEIKDIPSSKVERTIDTVSTSNFINHIIIKPKTDLISCELWLRTNKNVFNFALNGRKIELEKDSKSESYFFTLHAIHDKNVVLTYNSYTSEKVELTLIERTIGIPSDWLLSPFPDDMIYGTGIYSNTVITKKTYNLEVSK
jgi:hypothetical protein